MDAWGAPQWIIDAHAPDQGTQVCLDLRPTAKGSGFPAPSPIAAKTGPMPAHDGLGPHDRDDLEDRRKPTIQLDEEQAIAVRKVDATAHLSLQHNQLTSKRGVLCLKWLFDLNGKIRPGRSLAAQTSGADVRRFGQLKRMRFLAHTGSTSSFKALRTEK